jgi:hypothetical protein
MLLDCCVVFYEMWEWGEGRELTSSDLSGLTFVYRINDYESSLQITRLRLLVP